MCNPRLFQEKSNTLSEISKNKASKIIVPPFDVNKFQCKYNSDNDGFLLITSLINFAD